MQVNETKSSTRARILAMLRNERHPVSGVSIAETLGISRVAVWKAVQSLNEAGYRISGGQTGYILDADKADSVFPWEFGTAENQVMHFDETGSTMDRARDQALGGCESGLIILTERQSAGRGTGAKEWESPDGGLFFTMVTRPSLNSAFSHRLVLHAQLAMTDAITATTGIAAFPGWPNDILLETGKAGGILTETLSSGNYIAFLDLGIGINTGTIPSITDPLLGMRPAAVPVGRKRLMDAFLDSFSSYDSCESNEALVLAWNARCPIRGKTIRYRTALNEVQSGVFRGIDAAGWAIIETTEEIRCPPGSITVLDKGTHS